MRFMAKKQKKKKSLAAKALEALNNLRWALRGIKVFALVGKSGTGKSFRAKLIAEKYGIDMIIDDGLLIQGDKILAGKTAKREKYYLQAVKVALFDDPPHRQEAITTLENAKFKKILILGTSDKMVRRIAESLNLPEISKVIRIEEISSREEIEAAVKSRKEGKHIIPVPSIEIKRDNGHIFYDTIKIFFKNNGWFGKKKRNDVYEKTVVRPDFKDEDKGQLTISEAAIGQMVLHCVQEFDSSLKVLKIKVRADKDASYIISLSLAVPYKSQMAAKIHALQKYIVSHIEQYTGILLKEAHISIDKITKEEKVHK